jgi:leucyl aminopeptidase (aminopeptidase T)
MSEAYAMGADPSVITYPIRKYDREEPPKNVAAAMRDCDAFVAITIKSLSHTDARLKANAAGARGHTWPEVTEEMMLRTFLVNYNELSKYTKRVANAISNAKEVRLTSPSGTDVTLSFEGREALMIDGLSTERGSFSQLPAGLTGLAPVEGTANGQFVFDGSMYPEELTPRNDGLILTPIKWVVKDGRIVEISGGTEARGLKNYLEDVGDLNVYNIAEVGLGTNKLCKLTGNLLEDERAYGLIHIACGDNHTIGGRVTAKIHLDFSMRNATLEADGKRIVENGEILVQ